MQIIYGTSNKNKVTSMRKILEENNVNAQLYTLADIGFNQEIIEDGSTFEENSRIKADAIKKFCNENNIKDKIIITDDAGLCIDKLNGEPGVYSARYAGEGATQIQILEKVLNKMQSYEAKEDRSCTFICVLTAVLTDGEVIAARGECKGTVAKKPGKLGGLTYIPIFIPDGFDKPLSDLDEKTYEATHNHRNLAVKELLKEFKKRNLY
jgi:XTP/dITP diphosphohydrolase